MRARPREMRIAEKIYKGKKDSLNKRGKKGKTVKNWDNKKRRIQGRL